MQTGTIRCKIAGKYRATTRVFSFDEGDNSSICANLVSFLADFERSIENYDTDYLWRASRNNIFKLAENIITIADSAKLNWRKNQRAPFPILRLIIQGRPVFET